MVDDTSYTWKWFAQERLQRISPFIPYEMGMEFVRNMAFGELVEIVRESAGGLPLTNELKNFLDTDLIIVANDNGRPKYLAVEIALVANTVHLRRAKRNARILEELSNVTTLPVVASSSISNEVRSEVDSGQVYWHYVPDHVLDSRDIEKENNLSQLDQFRRVI